MPEAASGEKSAKKKFKNYPVGYFHIDIAEVHTAEGKLYLFVAVDRTCLLPSPNGIHKPGKSRRPSFCGNSNYAIHTVLTDNGIQFTNRQKDRHASAHLFDRVCHESNIEHRLTRLNHPWTNGQVERMNRTIKKATVRRFHYDSHTQRSKHLEDFIQAYHFARRLKTLRGLTPCAFICKTWTVFSPQLEKQRLARKWPKRA